MPKCQAQVIPRVLDSGIFLAMADFSAEHVKMNFLMQFW